ncbi:MAG TPA: hypothetical protein VGN34_26845 [Ktedonobacteraceae bacterium]|jgi:hypothetical protein
MDKIIRRALNVIDIRTRRPICNEPEETDEEETGLLAEDIDPTDDITEDDFKRIFGPVLNRVIQFPTAHTTA